MKTIFLEFNWFCLVKWSKNSFGIQHTHETFVDPEFYLSVYCVDVEFSGDNINRTTNMEADKGLVACKFYICGDAHYQHV